VKGSADSRTGQLEGKPGKWAYFEDVTVAPAIQLPHLPRQIGSYRLPKAVQLGNWIDVHVFLALGIRCHCGIRTLVSHTIPFYLLLGVGYGFAAAIQPGPFQAYLISRALSGGWRKNLPAALAPLLSDAPIITVTLLILSQVPGWLPRSLNVMGGLFVLYLAHSAFRNWQASGTGANSPDPGSTIGHGILRAAIVNVLNPAPYIYWALVAGPILLSGWQESFTKGTGFLASFYAAIVATLAILIFGFGSARRLGPRVNRALLGLSVVALAFFGLYQLWLAVCSIM
jgi:threonine/homoserine/homoserine lactone efflux protein